MVSSILNQQILSRRDHAGRASARERHVSARLQVRNFAPTTIRSDHPQLRLDHQVVGKRRSGILRFPGGSAGSAGQSRRTRNGSSAGDRGTPVRWVRFRDAEHGGIENHVWRRRRSRGADAAGAGLIQAAGKAIGRSIGQAAVQAGERFLERSAEALTSARELPVFLASVFFLMAVSALLAPASVLVDLATPAVSIRLTPGDDAGDAMYDFVEPPQEYDVIGGSVGVNPKEFQELKVRDYVLQPGDTLLGLSLKFDLNMDTLISFNQIEDVRRMNAGTEYQIPNRDGILHTVRRGDTLSGLAERHGTTVNDILDANDLASSTIRVDQVLFIPGARMDPIEVKLILGQLFRYPAHGRFTSGFGMRNDPFTGVRRFHNGIDLAGTPGSAVIAAMSGVVAYVGNQMGNYGRFVIMKHDRGFQTMYAHLGDVNVSTGAYLSQGQRLGTLGNSGRSTGPHLHFSIIKDGSFVDPMDYLH